MWLKLLAVRQGQAASKGPSKQTLQLSEIEVVPAAAALDEGEALGEGHASSSAALGQPLAARAASSPVSSSSTPPRSSEENEVEGVDELAGAQTWPSAIEGGRLTIEDRTHLPGGYHRLVVKCPWHVACMKRRNTNLCSSLGVREPLAFLAVWVQAGEGLSSGDHRRHLPSMAEQRRWLEANP